MAVPDFSSKTIDVLAKRAAFRCSNPDCRVNTVGPNSDPNKAVKIGEAAHIYGARIGSKRYSSDMTDLARGEITNAIWLCRNCHKLIDTDDLKYSSNVLFFWREKHEEYVSSIIGSSTDKIFFEDLTSELSQFQYCPPIVKRIVVDKPDYWEFRLTAELMRFLYSPLFRKIEDLRKGLYIKDLESIEDDDVLVWIKSKLDEFSLMIRPAQGLLEGLTKSWGEPGKSGDIDEIHHIVKLIREYLEHIVLYVEKIEFVVVSKKYLRLVSLFRELIASQVLKLSAMPSEIDEIIEIQMKYNDGVFNEEIPKEIRKEIVFEFPENLENEFKREFSRLELGGVFKDGNNVLGCGCLFFIIVFIVLYFLI